jgi:hypothetical protein
LEENVETETEKKVAVKVNELMKEVDDLITFLKALGEDVGLRLNKLFAQVDNIVVPLTNTVIKMEEAADHLTTFRETSEKVLNSLTKLEDTSNQAVGNISSFKMPELEGVGKQVNDIRDESLKALETVKLINEAAAKTVESASGAGAPVTAGAENIAAVSAGSQQALEAMRSLEELSKKLSDEFKASIKEASEAAIDSIHEVEQKTKQVLQEAQVARMPLPREAEPTMPREVAPAPRGGPPLPRPPAAEQETRGTTPAPPAPSPASSRAASAHIYSSSAEQVFNQVEESLNSTAGALAKSILDARDKIMGMTRKFGAIYELASTARELARYPQRTLDRREKEIILEKLASWRGKLAEAMSQS